MRLNVLLFSLFPVISFAYQPEYSSINISDITGKKATTKTITVYAGVESCKDTNKLRQKISELKLGNFKGCDAIGPDKYFVVFDVNATIGGSGSVNNLALQRSENPKKEYEFGAYFNDDWVNNVKTSFDPGYALINLHNDNDKIHYRSLVHSTGALFNNAPQSNFTHWLEPEKNVNVVIPLVSEPYMSMMDRKIIREPSEFFITTLKRADAGDVQAMYEVANLLDRMNEHVRTDRSKAHEWYVKAADNGHVISQYIAGENFYWMYSSSGNPEKLALSVKYIEKAAMANNPLAQYRLAHFLRSDLYGLKDFPRAKILMEASAKQGYFTAQSALAIMYFSEDNKTEGYAWALKTFNGEEYNRKELASLAALMTPEEISTAEQRAKILKDEFPVKTFDYE
ncbi:tetratricopeptide repeat protein [Morganella morganii]|uniref:tetratricopeptide repeat protein n=1 Tax=Morganella morganii TaxID=582 RepID=UPI0032DB1DC5